MKVLWFTNNPVNLVAGVLAGGWMQSLEQAISSSEDIELFIATRARKCDNPGRYVVANSTYYLISDKRSLLQKRIDNFRDHEPHEYFLAEYLSVIQEVKPDVIQVFGSEMDYGFICGKTTVPVIICIQGILHACLYQLAKIRFNFFQLARAQSLMDFIRGTTYSNGLRTFIRRTANEAKILKSCANVIGRTAWDKRVMSILAPQARYFHCDEMLRRDYFDHTWVFQPNGKINIVSVISTPAYKGHANITASCLVLKNAGIQFQWNIIGFDETSTAYKLFYSPYELTLNGLIRFHGSLTPLEMIDVLLKASVYVHPSHIENSSNALCEAMALGMPVIAMDVGGNVSMINDGIDGMIVPDHDPYSLAGMIADVSKNMTDAIKLGSNAKKRALVRHEPQKIVSNLKLIYAELVGLNENQR
jgi:glycosyltransferase involved in cell wall biosynthesis